MFNTSESAAIYRLKNTIKDYWNTATGRQVAFNLLTQDSIVIAGGCFTSLLRDEPPKDIDIFVLDNLEAMKLAHLHIDDGDHTDSDPQYDKSASKLNTNIVNVVNKTINGIKYQWIFTRYKTRQELINHFDFVHTKVSYDPIADKLYLSPETYHAIMNKELAKNGNNVVAIWRFDKFKNKGWKLKANQGIAFA